MIHTSGSSRKFTVVGAGLGGALMALDLAKHGHEVAIYEKRSDPRGGNAAAGRSINLAISTRGIAALERVGVAESVLQDAIPMRGRMLHSPAGELKYLPYAVDGQQAIQSVSRLGLNIRLMDAAEHEGGVPIHFDQQCVDWDPNSGEVTFEHGETGETTTIRDSVIVAADGAFSAIRGRMQRMNRFSYSQDYLAHGYKELTIPADAGGAFRIEKNALHIWPRGGYMMIALPNPDGSFTCTLFWPFEGPNSFAALDSPAKIESFFKEHFGDAVPMMPTLVEDYQQNPTSSLVTVRCSPWHHEDRAVLLGDACHAIVPFYGQGANAAFEDCIVLSECLEQHGSDLGHAFREYDRIRKENVDTLADLAIANFLEMRDHVNSPVFRARKQVEKAVARIAPWWYIPLYTMVTFSRIPYREAVRKARRQDRIVAWTALVLVLVVAIALIRWLT